MRCRIFGQTVELSLESRSNRCAVAGSRTVNGDYVAFAVKHRSLHAAGLRAMTSPCFCGFNSSSAAVDDTPLDVT